MKKFLLFLLLLVVPALVEAQIDPRLLPPGVAIQTQVDGVNLPAAPTVNFQESSTIDPSNPSAGIVQHAVKDASITDAKIAAGGITTRSKLPAPICYEDEACTFGGAISIGTAGSFSILGSISGTISFGRPASFTSYNWNYPATPGSSGQAMLSGGGGAAPMTFGTLGLAAGGTNQTSWTAARCVRVNASGMGLEAAAADCGTGGAGSITLIQGTPNEISISGGSGPTTTASLPASIDLSGKVLLGGSPLKMEGATADGFEVAIVTTDFTADRELYIPDANSSTIQAAVCTTGFRISAVSALGVITCSKVVENLTVNAQTGTSYPVVDGDFAKLITLSNVAAVAVTLPDPEGAGFDSGWFGFFQNRNVGVATITSTTSTIDGAASVLLEQNQGVLIVSDGVNYFTYRGIGGGSSLFSYTVATLPVSPGLGRKALITDGLTATDCVVGGGSTEVECRYDTDLASWRPILNSFTETQGFSQTTAINRTDYGATSIANRLQVGTDANNHTGIGDEPTEGGFIDCWRGGIRGNCNKGPGKLLDGKFFLIPDSAGVPIVRVLGTTGNSYYEMRENTADPTGTPPATNWRLYPKPGGWYAQSPAGTVTGPFGNKQSIPFSANDTAVGDTDYLWQHSDAADLPLTAGATGAKWMAGYAGRITKMSCNTVDAPVGAETYSYFVTKVAAGLDPGTAAVPTTMTFVQTSSATTGSTTTNPVSFVEGDFLGIQKIDSAGAAASNGTKCFLLAEAT